MLSDEIIEKVIARLTERIEQGNTYVLEQIGKTISKIGKLTPSNAYQLGQMIKYGGDYDKITKKLAEITQLNVKDIKKIFEEVAKSDYQFAEQFYKYRNKNYVPYKDNMLLRTQVDALANITANQYVNLSNTLAFSKRVNGKIVTTPLAQAYQETLDKAILSVSQGKTSFQEQMYSTIKELTESGLKTVDYASGRSMRVDTAVRMQMRGALRNLHNETQELIGKEFGADGVEISVHLNPAPDHAEVQGRQFSNEEFYKFQNDVDSYSYDKKFFPAEFEGHDRRAISQYNCYHYTFSIILGVNKPEYSNEELKKIIDDNNKGFTFEGKHYTNYEGTQLQRMLETEIRKQKDAQIAAKAAGNDILAGEAQHKIKILTHKYKELSDVSGLPTKIERLRVDKYWSTAKATKAYEQSFADIKVGTFDISKYTDTIKTTTNDVVFEHELEKRNKIKHREAVKYRDKLTDVIEHPDKVFIENERKNTIWVVKNVEGKDIQAIIKLNVNTLYQRKELGYKNSVIHFHPIRKGYLKSKLDKKKIKTLFDINKIK